MSSSEYGPPAPFRRNSLSSDATLVESDSEHSDENECYQYVYSNSCGHIWTLENHKCEDPSRCEVENRDEDNNINIHVRASQCCECIGIWSPPRDYPNVENACITNHLLFACGHGRIRVRHRCDNVHGCMAEGYEAVPNRVHNRCFDCRQASWAAGEPVEFVGANNRGFRSTRFAYYLLLSFVRHVASNSNPTERLSNELFARQELLPIASAANHTHLATPSRISLDTPSTPDMNTQQQSDCSRVIHQFACGHTLSLPVDHRCGCLSECPGVRDRILGLTNIDCDDCRGVTDSIPTSGVTIQQASHCFRVVHQYSCGHIQSFQDYHRCGRLPECLGVRDRRLIFPNTYCIDCGGVINGNDIV